MTTPFTFLTLEIADALAIVTVNRPDKLNALNATVIAELDKAFTELSQREQVRAIILTGAGRAFVAGADIAEIAEGADSPAGLESLSQVGSRVFTKIERLNKPVVAAINGFALGGGLELALACHVRVASEGAKFGLPEAKLGLIPGYGGTQRLPRLIGTGRAMQMILTGGMIDANTAASYGLVNAVYPAEVLLDVTRSMAKEMIANGPLALAHAIEVVAKGAGMSMDDALALESRHFGVLGRTADMREGTTAFLEKRPAAFKGA
ncbi:enoyl-CoA hydratase-related protein [Pseudogemmatithrix spongiicola]|uniref:Enoyl-CoA hydratase-related protein n=1 Tax=Pseudogemmatithrix spongiicola TaxID=3062599 RepID=A0AA49JYR4_9BACT|nr:enoyl-CoA hydratase-related protein [Gemmatimonadaceae bacterium 'strain 138']WKW14267.1 enoyl-CoA hydratase-related protein [Gemmatimonadaceae bacterium 'strain 318']